MGATLSSYMSHPLELVWPGGSWASEMASAPAHTARAPPPPPPPPSVAQAALPTVALNLTSAQAGGLVKSPNPPSPSPDPNPNSNPHPNPSPMPNRRAGLDATSSPRPNPSPNPNQAGREDLVRAAQALCEEGMRTPHPAGWVDEDAVGRQLKAHAGWPDPVSC